MLVAVYPVAPNRCVIEAARRRALVDLPGFDDPLEVPLERLRYLPTGEDEHREVELAYLGGADLRDRYWSRLRGEAMCDAADMRDAARMPVAADIWLRVHRGVLGLHFFKNVDWVRFIAGGRWKGDYREYADGLERSGDEHIDTVRLLQRIGRTVCRRPPRLHDQLARLHFSDPELAVASPVEASAFLAEHADAIIQAELDVRRDRGSGADVVIEGAERTAFDRTLRNRLARLRRVAERDGPGGAAVNLEALVVTITSMDVLYENLSVQLAPVLSPLASELFRLLHIAGHRRAGGGIAPVPVIWSDTLKSTFRFAMGDQPGEWALTEAVIVPDLLAVLEEGGISEPYEPAVHLAVGFTEVWRAWVLIERDAQRARQRRLREP